MCDFVKRFLACLEPIIVDLDDRKDELAKIKNELDSVNDFLKYVDGDVKKIGKYHNQEFIHQNLTSVDSEVSDYKAMVYLIDTDNTSIQKIPQYQIAIEYMEKIIESLTASSSELTKIYLSLDDEYSYKIKAKKYYDLFQNEDVYVLDYSEFVEFFLTLSLTEEDKIDILSYTVKMNVEYYRNNVNENIEIDREQDMKKIQEIIHKNKNLLSNEYDAFIEGIGKYVNLSLNIKKIINEDILAKIDIKNLVLAKNIYLTNKITQNYKSCEFGLVSKYIKEYEELMVLKEKIENINNKDEIIEIIKGGY